MKRFERRWLERNEKMLKVTFRKNFNYAVMATGV